jgi:predicted nucleic acid-binding protein
LHSIGVILLRNKKEKIFEKFTNDILHRIPIITLSKDKYKYLAKTARKFNLDFDDSYQTCIAIERNLEIVTMDNDFVKVREIINVRFL